MNTSDSNSKVFIPKWVEGKRIVDGSVAAVIQRSDHYRPYYSYEIVFVRNGKQSRFCSVYRINSNTLGRAAIEENSNAIFRVIKEAEAYILAAYQLQEDNAIEQRAEKERASLDRGKPATKPGLKELAKRDRRAKEVKP